MHFDRNSDQELRRVCLSALLMNTFSHRQAEAACVGAWGVELGSLFDLPCNGLRSFLTLQVPHIAA